MVLITSGMGNNGPAFVLWGTCLPAGGLFNPNGAMALLYATIF
jgi:hypothetical protein